MTTVYNSRIDTWLLLLLIGTVILVAVPFVLSFKEGTNVALARLPALVIGAGLPVWVLVGTKYTLDDTTLHVRCGPFSWRVPLIEIDSITPTRTLLSSPALSIDRLRIEYSRGKVIVISPENKEEFLQDLARRQGAQG